MQTKKWASVGLAAAFLALASTGWADVLSDNLSEATADLEYLSGPTQVAAGFKTDYQSYYLDNVMLWLGNPVPGQAALSLYSDNASQPGSLVGTLLSPSLYFPDLASMTFGGNNLFLEANTSYWIVLQALSGQFTWGWTESNFGTGPGFVGNWAVRTSPGAWTTFDGEPTQMQVNATATPEPGSLALLGAGLLGLGFFARRKRTAKALKPLVLAAAAVTLPVSAAVAAPRVDRTLIEVKSPKLGETLHGAFAKVEITISSAANRGKFSAKLNGKDVTNLFSRSGHCRGGNCAETAILTPAFGLMNGTNIMRLRIMRFDGKYDYQRLRFLWTASPEGTAAGRPVEMTAAYNFTTLTPGGFNGAPWFQISSNGLYGTTTTYPADTTACTTRYTLVTIDRQNLTEIAKSCLEADGLTTALPNVSASQFAVVGSNWDHNSDPTTLDLSPIGGTDFRTTTDPWSTPAGLMAIGVGGAPSGTAYQSYLTAYDPGAPDAQIAGLLSVNAHNYYDFHPSGNISFTLDGPNKSLMLKVFGTDPATGNFTFKTTTFTPPTPTTESGFWVLRLNRIILRESGCFSHDGGITYPNCGFVYNHQGDADDLASELDNLLPRELAFIVGWGRQPGLDNPQAFEHTVAAMNNLGVPYSTYARMESSDSVFAVVSSSDPSMPKTLLNSQMLFSANANTASGQNGILTGLLTQDMNALYTPGIAFQQDPENPADADIVQIGFAPSQPFPYMDTPGRVGAYRYLSYTTITSLFPNPPSVKLDDIRYLYTFPDQASKFSGKDPRSYSSYPPEGSFLDPVTNETYVFSEDDYTTVGEQLNRELSVMQDVFEFLGDGGDNGLGLESLLVQGDSLGVWSLFSDVDAIRNKLEAPATTTISADMGNILNMAGAIVSIAASIAAPEMAPILGVAAGALWGAGSAGLLDFNSNDGVALPIYALDVTEEALLNGYQQYTQHADAAYDVMLDNILSDWSKMNAVSYGTNNQWIVPENVDRQSIVDALKDGSSRHFYLSLSGAVYSLDAFWITPPGADGTTPAAPNVYGSYKYDCDEVSCYPTACASPYPYSAPTAGWAAFQSFVPSSTSPLSFDVLIMAVNGVSNIGNNNMQETFPSSDVLTDMFTNLAIPVDQFYIDGPLPSRGGPRYSPYYGYCRLDGK